MAKGFVDLVEAFLHDNAATGHYIVPVKLNGSAVETVFSQVKYISGGKLTGLNYATALRNMDLQKELQGTYKRSDDYRNVPLCIASTPVVKKQRNKWKSELTII